MPLLVAFASSSFGDMKLTLIGWLWECFVRPIVNNQSAPLTPAAIGNHILVLHALEASWIEVTDVSGARVFTRLMSAGDHVAIDEGGRPLSVLIGNAAGVRVYSRSKALDPLTKPASTWRDLTLIELFLYQLPPP